MKKTILLLLGLLGLWGEVQAQDIDSPLSVKEIGNYKNRVTIKRLTDVAMTHPDAYRIQTEEKVYSPKIKKIYYDYINVSGPTASPEERCKLFYWKDSKWQEMPMKDFVIAGVGMDLNVGDTIQKWFFPAEYFQLPLSVASRYKYQTTVNTRLKTIFEVRKDSICSVKSSEQDGAFTFKVLDSRNDSIRILMENHTNLTVVPWSLPDISHVGRGDAVHPYAASGWSGESDYMRKNWTLKPGAALLFTIPLRWDVNKLGKYDRERYKQGQLTDGKYEASLLCDVRMTTEFEVNDSVPLPPKDVVRVVRKEYSNAEYEHLKTFANSDGKSLRKAFKLEVMRNGKRVDELPCELQYADDEDPMQVDADSIGQVIYKDVNFDGYDDLLVYRGAFGNQGVKRYECFVWNHWTDSFYSVDGFAKLSNPEFDADTKTIVTFERGNAATYHYYRYKFVNGITSYSMMGSITEKVNAQGKSTYTERKRINGVMKVVRANVPLSQISKDWKKWLE